MCQCIIDAQKDKEVWGQVSSLLPPGIAAQLSGMSAADCIPIYTKAMAANGGLTVSPSFLFAATAAGLAMFGTCARFA
jgi:hypothetical protein